MRRIWFSSQFQLKNQSALLALVIAFTLSAPLSAEASRNGVEEPTNTFTVGISFKFGEIEELCSGAMLTSTLVITAGHCAISPTGVKGSDYLFTKPGVRLDAAIDPRIVQPKVIKIITDPQFSAQDINNFNDIAFLQLDKPFYVERYLKLATASDLAQLTAQSQVAGYGYGKVYESGANYSLYPRRYQLSWEGIDSNTVLANTFTVTSPVATACKGDSGGPILATLPNGGELLVGVLSGASAVVDGCGTPAPDGSFYLRMTTGHPFLPLIKSLYDPLTGRAPLVKTTIRCKKGSAIKKVTALKPACPKGYTRLK